MDPHPGRNRLGPDQFAGLRWPAGGALDRAAEPGRLFQGSRGRGDQPGHRPRTRGRTFFHPEPARAAPGPAAGATTRPGPLALDCPVLLEGPAGLEAAKLGGGRAGRCAWQPSNPAPW